jgi:fatty-acid desaturase
MTLHFFHDVCDEQVQLMAFIMMTQTEYGDQLTCFITWEILTKIVCNLECIWFVEICCTRFKYLKHDD